MLADDLLVLFHIDRLMKQFERPVNIDEIGGHIGPNPDPATRVAALGERGYVVDLIQPGGPNYELTAKGVAALEWWRQHDWTA